MAYQAAHQAFRQGNPAEKVLGIIDLGSNSARLLLVRVLPSGATIVVNRVKHMVRLGEHSFQKHLLQETAMQRTLLVLRAFAAMCATYGAQDVLAIATSAVRDAENGRAFIRRVREKTGLDFNIISGKEEARLIYLGVSSGLPLSLGPRLFIDIGGGSTELAVASSAACENLDSLKLGCVRLTNAFLEGHAGPIPPERFAKMQQLVRREAAHALNRIRNFSLVEAVGSSGTAQALHTVAFKLEHDLAPAPEQDVLSYAGLRHAVAHICSLSLEERRKTLGLSTRRAEVLVAGAAILLTLQEELGLDSLRISTRNLQDGVLVDYLRCCGLGSMEASLDVREHSVLQLAARCNFEERHARHVGKLTLLLHDSAVDCGLMDLEHRARELLHYAALLHDIGIFIAYARHASHGYYLIHNTELLGFHEREIAFMALLTLFHSSRPSKKHEAFARCDAPLRGQIRLFSLFLALAENMDRLHCQHVREAEFIRDVTGLVLRVVSDTASPVEVEAVQGMSKALYKTLGEEVRIEFVVLD